MKLLLRIFAFASLIFLLGCSFSACTGSQSAQSQLSTTPTEDINKQALELSAQFEVGPLTVRRSGVTVGESAIVTTTITNVGHKEGTYRAALKVDGREVEIRNISIAPGQTKEVSFKVTPTTPGTKKIEIGESAAMLSAYYWPFTILYDSDLRAGGKGPEHGVQSYGTAPPSPPSISLNGDYGHMVRFTPPAVPFKIQKILVNGEGRVKNKNEWDNNSVTIRVWDDKNNLVWSVDVPWRLFRYPGDWNEIPVPDVRVNGDFYVEIVTHSGKKSSELTVTYLEDPTLTGIFISWDKPQSQIAAPATLIETRSTISYNGKSVEVPSIYKGLNWYIRAVGDGSLGN